MIVKVKEIAIFMFILTFRILDTETSLGFACNIDTHETKMLDVDRRQTTKKVFDILRFEIQIGDKSWLQLLFGWWIKNWGFPCNNLGTVKFYFKKQAFGNIGDIVEIARRCLLTISNTQKTN